MTALGHRGQRAAVRRAVSHPAGRSREERARLKQMDDIIFWELKKDRTSSKPGNYEGHI
jgi:hypothetical protein